MMKKLMPPLLITIALSLVMPIGTFFVEPIASFGFLVICLLFAFPICFAGIGVFCGTQIKCRVAWTVPLVCVLLWTLASYLQVQNDSLLWYCPMYLGVSYAAMLLTVLILYVVAKTKGTKEQSK